MPLQPPRSLQELLDLRQFSTWCAATKVTPSPDSVTTTTVSGATTAANDRFYVKRAGALTFGAIGDSDIPAGIARDTEVAAGDAATAADAAANLTAHVSAPDPHPQYLTQTEGDARYSQLPLSGSATYDPASLGDGVGATTTITVTGAALGDFVMASFSLDLQGITLTGYVSAADTVSVRFQNESGGTLDLGSGTLRARVFK